MSFAFISCWQNAKHMEVTVDHFWLIFHAKEKWVHIGTVMVMVVVTQCIQYARWSPPLVATRADEKEAQ